MEPHSPEPPKPTFMLETYSRSFCVGGSKRIRVHITEISLDNCHSIAARNLRKVDIAIVTYDVSRPDTYPSIKKWLQLLEGSPPSIIIVAGTKNDCIVPSDRSNKTTVHNILGSYRRMGWPVKHIKVHRENLGHLIAIVHDAIERTYTKTVPRVEKTVPWRPVVLTATKPTWECAIL